MINETHLVAAKEHSTDEEADEASTEQDEKPTVRQEKPLAPFSARPVHSTQLTAAVERTIPRALRLRRCQLLLGTDRRPRWPHEPLHRHKHPLGPVLVARPRTRRPSRRASLGRVPPQTVKIQKRLSTHLGQDVDLKEAMQ